MVAIGWNKWSHMGAAHAAIGHYMDVLQITTCPTQCDKIL